MTLETLPGWAGELVERARVARLAYVDGEDRPRVLPVTFAVEGGAVWIAIDDKPKRRPQPARVGYLRRRPEAALVVDEYDDDWSRLWWVRCSGAAREVDDAIERGTALDALASKYRRYAVEPPDGPVVAIDIDHISGWQAAPDLAS